MYLYWTTDDAGAKAELLVLDIDIAIIVQNNRIQNTEMSVL